jgi:chromosome segregation ATPase
MSRVYESLRGVVQRNKSNSVPLVRITASSALTVNEEMEELERIVLDRIARLKAAVNEGEAVVAGETEHAEQLIESLKASITTLEGKVREAEDTIRRKDSASQKMEESLTAKIHDLQNDVKKKDDALESRSSEISDLRSKIDGQVKQVAQLESTIQKAKAEAASQAKRAEQVSESSRAKIAALEAQLRDTEEIVRRKESTIKGLEQSLAARVQDFENEAREKDRLLEGRDADIDNLKSQLQLLTRGIKEMSVFFKQAEGFAAVDGQNGSAVAAGEPLNEAEEKLATVELSDPVMTSNGSNGVQQTVPPNFFDRVTVELTQALGPMASMIVRDHVAALGESMEKFPTIRVGELLDTVSQEISDERQKIGFRVRLSENV